MITDERLFNEIEKDTKQLLSELKEQLAELCKWYNPATFFNIVTPIQNKLRELERMEQQELDLEIKKRQSAPQWTPEVGKLYKSSLHPKGVEIIRYETPEITPRMVYVLFSDGFKGYSHKEDFIKHFTPISELEGLEVGDEVFSIDDNGDICKWTISRGRGNGDSFICRSGWQSLSVLNNGVPVFTGNGQQLFWRTADRAERFGRCGS